MADDASPTYVPLIVPSDRAWFDPRLFGANVYTQQTDVPVDPLAPTLIAPANPQRWALLFTMAPGSGGGAVVGPFTDLTTLFGIPVPQPGWLYYYLPRDGALVQAAWYATSGAGAVTRVVEQLRR